ncbi:MAG: methylenetetrahydrofolate reductase [NAD(P)H] [Paracoccaceae bacterium]|nr:methylenetetrahydrofolate reductase [NAD(P)H] [Paracoccaceae bacterium]NCW15325.1 methylenetetrahydrofolate reductase [NAD(P)H] [Paracoccaceae bacterium]
MTSLNVSFEFFPPKTIEASFRLWDTVQTLAPLAPRFVSVTYGAGGTTRQLTREAVAAIAGSTDLSVAAHLTCVDATKEDTLSLAKSWADLGVKDIVALRGDPPKGTEGFAPHPEGFANSCEMIEALAASGDFNIRVGAYPHKHPEAASLKDDVDWLKRKIDAGASEAITQFFFEADDFFRFRDLCDKAGITAPITPGILPIENWAGTKAFAQRCGAQIPDWMDAAFQTALRDDRSDLLSVALSTELCSDLIDGGVENFHFYTLNKPELTRDICAAIGVTPQTVLQKVA